MNSGQLHRRPLTDYFLHEQFFAEAGVVHRARVLVIALYVFVATTLAAIPTLFLASIDPLLQVAISTSCLLTALAFVYLLFMLKHHGKYMLCAAVATSIPIVSITLAIGFTGGLGGAPSTQLLGLQPLVGYFFAGVRGGVITTIVVGVVIGAFLGLESAGVTFPQITPGEYLSAAWGAVLLVGLVVIAAMALAYEFTSMVLRRERDAEHAKVIKLANTDSLTGLANRRAFDDALNARIAMMPSTTSDQCFALCYLDLDGFKPINDQYGHDVGDQVLRAISIRLRSALRGSDLIGRQGGDEFMLLLSGLDSPRAVARLAERFVAMIKQPIETSAGLVSVGASLGFALCVDRGSSAEQLKRSADSAMYDAKRSRAGWSTYVHTDDKNANGLHA